MLFSCTCFIVPTQRKRSCRPKVAIAAQKRFAIDSDRKARAPSIKKFLVTFQIGSESRPTLRERASRAINALVVRDDGHLASDQIRRQAPGMRSLLSVELLPS